MTIWFATGNIHKKEELADILSGATLSGPILKNPSDQRTPAWKLKIPSDVGISFEPEETGTTFLENALIKAKNLHYLLFGAKKSISHLCDPVIADDSGLCVDALDGRPGIHSARYGGKELDAAGKNTLLLGEIGDNPLRSARFVCAMVLYYGPDHFFAAQECLEGELVKNIESARGSGGFGYDPILFLPELGRTVAELSEEEKNRLSHRGKAGRAIGRMLW